MPRIPGSSKKVTSENIAELVRSGFPPKQAAAIEFDSQRKAKGKKRKPSVKKKSVKRKRK